MNYCEITPVRAGRDYSGYRWYNQSGAPRRFTANRSRSSSASRAGRAAWRDRLEGAVIAVIGVTASEVFFDGTIVTVIRWIGELL